MTEEGGKFCLPRSNCLSSSGICGSLRRDVSSLSDGATLSIAADHHHGRIAVPTG